MTAVPPSAIPSQEQSADSTRGQALAVVGYVLLALSLFTVGLSGLVALILAYDRKGQSGALARSHFGFQIALFWICFALTMAAGALWISGLIGLLTSAPAGPPVHGSPDAQLVSLAAPRLWPADVETWSYGFAAGPPHMSQTARLELWAGSASMLASVLLSWFGSGFGLVRLASGRPIGQSRTAQPDPAS